jgi:hypothetical protein
LPGGPESLAAVSYSGPFVKMGQDVGRGYYSSTLLESLGEEQCQDRTPLNAGLMYLYGDFSVYPKWKELCHFLSTDHSPMGANYNEQTTFAILAHHFNTRPYWEAGEVLIKTDDIYNLKYTRKYFPGILARHYVHTRPTAFWRDFVFICWQKRVSNKKGLYLK